MRCKAKENRLPDSNSYSVHMCMKRILSHALETQIFTVNISQSTPVNLVSYLSFFHNCFYGEGTEKKRPRKKCQKQLHFVDSPLSFLLSYFCMVVFHDMNILTVS